MTNVIGMTLDNRFTIVRQLGKGGMAEVFLANDLENKTEVAIKIIAPSNLETPAFLTRFKREFEICSSLNHTNIIKLYSYGKTPDDSSLYYAMEYLPCKDLRAILKENGKLRPSQVRQIVLQLARAFEHYHAKGIVHRDLKPENIMLQKNGRLVVMDFGLVLDPSKTQLTKTGFMVGTPLYMSPELIRRGKVDHRSDIFQLGTIAHECLCGKTAFQGRNIAEVATNIIGDRYTPIRKIDPAISQEWETFLLKCLHKTPGKRFDDATTIIKQVQKLSLPSSTPRKDRSKGTVSFGRSSCLDDSALGFFKNSPIDAIGKLVDEEKNKTTSKSKKIKKSTKRKNSQRKIKAAKVASSNRNLPFILTSLVMLIVTAAACFYLFYKDTPKTVIHSFQVISGRQSALIKFTSNNRLSPQVELSSKPSTKLEKDIDYECSPPQIKACASKEEEKEFSHSFIISGLDNESDYVLSLVLDSKGDKTLPKNFSTIVDTPQLTTKLKKNGDLHLCYTSKIPFSFTSNINSQISDKASKRDEKDYFLSKELLIPFPELKENKNIEVSLTSIDQDSISWKKKSHVVVGEALDKISSQFFKTRNRVKNGRDSYVPSFDMWKDQKTRQFIFDSSGTYYSKIKDEIVKSIFAANFWGKIEQQLMKECDWFNNFQPLLPGLPAFIHECKMSNQLRQKIARALIGIEVLQGAAVAGLLPENPDWISLTNRHLRPFPCSIKTILPSVDLTVHGTRIPEKINNHALPFHFLYDIKHPKTYKRYKDSILLTFLTDHNMKFILPDDLSKYSSAELVVDFRTFDNPGMIVLMNVNGNEFEATIRPTAAEALKYSLGWITEDSYEKTLFMGLSGNKKNILGQKADGSAYTDSVSAIASCKELMITVDKNFPTMTNTCIHHPLPVSALKNGENYIKVILLNSPSSSMIERLTYKNVSILLSK